MVDRNPFVANVSPNTVVTPNDTQTLTNKTLNSPVLQGAIERFTVYPSPYKIATTYNIFPMFAQNTLWVDQANNNWVPNVLLSFMTFSTGQSFRVVLAVPQGATPYYSTGFQIDSVSVTPKWEGGTAPTSGNANSIDVYTYNIVKTSNTPTYTVFASRTKFA